jgi:histidine kinase/DNA gyrase B/HSP90-like ATPase
MHTIGGAHKCGYSLKVAELRTKLPRRTVHWELCYDVCVLSRGFTRRSPLPPDFNRNYIGQLERGFHSPRWIFGAVPDFRKQKNTAAMQGRGLGLTNMQERVRLVKGTISIESKPMSGTTIHVRVPLKQCLLCRRTKFQGNDRLQR